MKIERLERIASSRLKKLEAIRKKSERLERSNEKLKNIIVMLKKKLVEHNIHKPGDIMKVHLPPSSHI